MTNYFLENEVDRFDVAIALHHWLQHNWESQWCDLYSGFCQLSKIFTARGSDEYFETIPEEAKRVYDLLTEDNWVSALEYVRAYKPQD